MVEQTFFSPQVKRSIIISNKLMYTSYLRVVKRLKTQDLRKLGDIRNISKLHRMIA